MYGSPPAIAYCEELQPSAARENTDGKDGVIRWGGRHHDAGAVCRAGPAECAPSPHDPADAAGYRGPPPGARGSRSGHADGCARLSDAEVASRRVSGTTLERGRGWLLAGLPEVGKRGRHMLALKYLLMILGVGLFGSSGILVAYDIYIAARLRRLLEQTSGEPGTEAVQRKTAPPFGPVRGGLALQLAPVGIVPLLLALSIVAVPDGTPGIAPNRPPAVPPPTSSPPCHFLPPP